MKVANALGLLGATAAVLALDQVPTSGRPLADVVPGKYILQFDHTADVPTNKRAESPHAAVYEALAKRRIGFRVRKEYKHEGIFVGAAVVLDSEKDYKALETTPGVTGIYPVTRIPAPKPVSIQKGVNGTKTGNTVSTHVATGVDKLHNEGLFGSGIKVGIIDTGVDYEHPSLGGGFGKGYKVAGGWDFVGDDYDGYNDPVPDQDPLDRCIGHGTHVAGIVGADGNNQFGLIGVAPKASLYAYRVFGCGGSSDDSVIIDAMLRAYSDGMDVITLSLGSFDGWSWSPKAEVADRIADRGKIVTVAAGNDGEIGPWFSSSPSGGRNVISVASTDNTAASAQKAMLSGVDREYIVYNGLSPIPIPGKLPVYATSADPAVLADACEPFPSDTPDLSASAVLIRRGECPFLQKIENAAAYGAQYFLFYNNVDGLEPLNFGDYGVSGLIPNEHGEYLVGQLNAGRKPFVEFPQKDAYTQWTDPSGGKVSYYTTYGPTFDMFLKPQIAAPGGNILSTWMTNDGDWAVISGTSMATPFMAGVSALLFQAKGKSAATAKNARKLFMNTAKPVASTRDKSLLHTLAQQGSGLVDAYAAVRSTTFLSTDQILLNDTQYFKPLQIFTIENKSRKIKTYKIGHVSAETIPTLGKGEILPLPDNNLFPLQSVSNGASVKFGLNSVTLLPGFSLPVIATFSPPKGLDPETYPVYSGWITVTDTSSKEVHRIPYMGLAAKLATKRVVRNPLFLGGGGIVSEPTNFTFAGRDFPIVLFGLGFGTRLFQIDLVSPDIKYNATKHQTFKSIKTVGTVFKEPYTTRNAATPFGDLLFSEVDFQRPIFENGATVPRGQYKYLIRALKLFGNAAYNEDYESYLSAIIGYNYA
ncbi:subtilisin-like protease [Auricularia subglabra TFB-10046 SS5]|nr:subtilisin-like protease [Auricularia subglabra TFB-10046 SS5]